MISNTPNNPIPFLLADRPKSLELLKYSEITKQPFPVGLMGNANSTNNFQKEFRKFKGKNVIKLADSGIFTKDGGLSKNYDELFKRYERMGTDYGIIFDVIKNKDKTIASAKAALIEYKKKRRSFKLVGVAQGRNVRDYLSCYRRLKTMGYKNIAIGGLLKKRTKSVRYAVVRKETFLELILSTIRSKYPNDWIFLLGCYRPKRLKLFKQYKVYGADFKGWILNYRNPGEKRADALRNLRHIEDAYDITSKKLKILQNPLDHQVFRINSYLEKQRLQNIINIKKKIANKIKNEEYNENLHVILHLMNTNPRKLRKFRFEQVKRFLHKHVFSPMHTKRLLIISCSERKKNMINLTPAVSLYDGPMFRMIRNFDPIYYNGVDLMILSSRYGLIDHNHLIRNYDERLANKNIPLLQQQTKERLRKKLATAEYDEIMLSMGKDYLKIFDGIKDLVSNECRIIKCEGRIGEKLHKTKKWLGKS